jgi:hypothetical protein
MSAKLFLPSRSERIKESQLTGFRRGRPSRIGDRDPRPYQVERIRRADAGDARETAGEKFGGRAEVTLAFVGKGGEVGFGGFVRAELDGRVRHDTY